jgi:hypothetical protein
MRKSGSLLIFSFFILFENAHAIGPSCSFNTEKEKIQLVFRNKKEAEVTIKGKNKESFVCLLSVEKAIDLRQGVTAMIRVPMFHLQNCFPQIKDFRSRITQRPTLDIFVSDKKRKAAFSWYRKLGFRPCEIKNYSASFFGI